MIEELESNIRVTWRAMQLNRREARGAGAMQGYYRERARMWRTVLLVLLDVRRAGRRAQ